MFKKVKSEVMLRWKESPVKVMFIIALLISSFVNPKTEFFDPQQFVTQMIITIPMWLVMVLIYKISLK